MLWKPCWLLAVCNVESENEADRRGRMFYNECFAERAAEFDSAFNGLMASRSSHFKFNPRQRQLESRSPPESASR